MSPTGPNATGSAHFDALVEAQTIAIIGASSNPETLSGRPLGYLKQHGFAGRIYPVNPTRDEVQGVKSYPSVTAIPEPIDVAMVAVRAELVPDALRDCIAAKVKVAVVVSSGFGEGMGRGADLKATVEELLATTDMRVMGPNCEGLLAMPNAMPLTFSPVVDNEKTGQPLISGDIAVISQSGGLGFAVAQWGLPLRPRDLSYVMSTGNEIDIDAVEFAEYLIERDDARVLVMLVEGFDHHERIGRLGARAHELGKHIVVSKLGRTEPGKRAAYNHTGHDPGDEEEYAELFRSAGFHQAVDEEDLIDTIQILSKAPPMGGKRIGVVTTSGGAGVWLADCIESEGLEIPILSDRVQDGLKTNMPGYGSPVNPVDLTAQFFAGGTFTEVLELLYSSGEVDAVVIVTSLAAAGRLEREQDGFRDVMARFAMPLLVFSYTKPAAVNVAILNGLNIPWFDASGRVAKSLARLARAGGSRSESAGLLRRARSEERLDRRAVVVGRVTDRLGLAAERRGALERQLEGPIDDRLHQHDRPARLAGVALRVLAGLREKAPVGREHVDEADRHRLVGVDEPPGVDEILGLLEADPSGQVVHPSAVGDKRPVDEAGGESRLWRGDDEVACASARSRPSPTAWPLTAAIVIWSREWSVAPS